MLVRFLILLSQSPFLTFSKYPHTKVIDDNNANRQYSDIERLAYTSVMKNADFDS